MAILVISEEIEENGIIIRNLGIYKDTYEETEFLEKKFRELQSALPKRNKQIEIDKTRVTVYPFTFKVRYPSKKREQATKDIRFVAATIGLEIRFEKKEEEERWGKT